MKNSLKEIIHMYIIFIFLELNFNRSDIMILVMKTLCTAARGGFPGCCNRCDFLILVTHTVTDIRRW